MAGSLLRKESYEMAQTYMKILHLLGLRQADIARHFAITTVQVNHWAKGKRPIPEKYMPMIDRLIASRIKEKRPLAALKDLTALFEELNRIADVVEKKVNEYIDRGVVLRELWSIERG